MVIGNGLIGKALSSYQDLENIIVFASGVSNSTCSGDSDFNREKELLLKYKNTNARLLYFSTCSVFDKTLLSSRYVEHKINMEQIIAENFKDYIILRLPTLVGKTNNPHTFFNNFKFKLLNSEPVIVFKKASRYLLAIDDLPLIIETVLHENKTAFTINVAFNNKVGVVEIVEFMKQCLKSNSDIILEDKGFDLTIENSDFINLISKNSQAFYSLNYKDVIKRYV